jgi:DNA-binding transcriptional LysR family regulator
MQTIVNLVSAGMGVAWVPAALRQLQRPGVVYRPVTDGPGECHTSLLLPHATSPVVQRFVATVLGRPDLASPPPSRGTRPDPSARKRQSGRTRLS